MTNLGNIGLSALTAKNENTLALANLNFDFSLFKIEAPAQFQPLGNTLSPGRRTAAETGAAHRTARKLGALFEQVVTIPDQLFVAYGTRVSEISKSGAISSEKRRKYGVFSGHVGADGTSIWAAATSGKSAMAVNLLACMLARLWSSSEAISIWVELVDARKRRIAEQCDGSEPSHVVQMAAAQQEVTRKDLAEWDASARSWISFADKVKEAEHKKMEGVLQGIDLPVDNSTDVYKSVMRAWDNAMSAMGKLLQGMPQLVNGAVLIAMSAWHLYPDVEKFSTRAECVYFGDQLIPQGGHVTTGLEYYNDEDSRGIYWSLSLGHLRFYGDPVVSTVSSIDESKVSFDDFTLVVLGGLLGLW
ncbi:hypothetical protein M406DRAFT_296428, partial [Cryphonectria parasitica EP155]